jgi:hydroxyacyl-ACP dehydratase HTD2-like protein with hotdog domain
MAIRVLGTALVPMDELRPDGNFFGPLPPLDVTRSLGGEMTIELLGDICAGDAITVQSQIVDLYEKSGRSGDLVFVVFERNYLNDRDELVVDERTTTVFR